MKADSRYERHLESQVLRSLGAFSVVYLNGPRQAGKSTLARMLIDSGRFKAKYVSFDSGKTRSTARLSPSEFLRAQGGPLVIDEVQRVPEIFDAIKSAVDDKRYEALTEGDEDAGLYLLTGSASLDVLPLLAHAMTGRMVTRTLLPLSVGEAIGSKPTFLERCFGGDFSGIDRDGISVACAIGMTGFPRPLLLPDRERSEWYEDYENMIALQDIGQIYSLEKAECLPGMLQSLALRAGSLVNDASLGRELGLNAVTTKTYRRLLNQTFVTNSLAPWTRNFGKRLVKSKKIYFCDTMFLCHLLGSSPGELALKAPHRFGHVLENFVFSELEKANHASSAQVKMSYFRTSAGSEVDFVLERDRKVVAIEVKQSENVSKGDIKGIFELKEALGESLLRSVVLCNVPHVLPFGEDIYLVPFSALWR